MTEPIFKEEEKAILLSVDKALASSNNAQTIGRNGELPLLTFLNNYLPPTLKAVSGHFVTPTKQRSPQLDIMVLDSRYPLLGYNSDGTVLAMAHTVLKIIEVKTNLTSKDIAKTEVNFQKIRSLLKDLWTDKERFWANPELIVIAYRLAVKQETIESAYFSTCSPTNNHFDISVLRSQKKSDSGCLIHFEPMGDDWPEIERIKCAPMIKENHLLMIIPERTPLSDFYYTLIQNAYYALDDREYSLGDIGQHFMDYLDWTSISHKKTETNSKP